MAEETEGPSGNEDNAPMQSIMPDGGATVEGVSSPNADSVDHALTTIIDELGPGPFDNYVDNIARQAIPMSPEEFAEQVAKTRLEVSIQSAADNAKREERLKALSEFVKAVVTSNAEAPHDNFYTRTKDAEAISNLSRRLKEINFTEADAAWTARLLDGHLDWQMGTENGRWYLQETKAKNPKRFSTTFRFASGAMRVMTLLNTGHSIVDANLLATVGASQRLEDLIKTLDEDLQREFNTLLEYLDKPVL